MTGLGFRARERPAGPRKEGPGRDPRPTRCRACTHDDEQRLCLQVRVRVPECGSARVGSGEGCKLEGVGA